MNLAWTPSTDNVGVTGYEVYRGTSSTTITAYALSPVNSFLDLAVAPSKTYYYQIDAYDAANNHSPRSSIVTATTLPDTTPPTTPTGLTVTMQSGPVANLTWSASTDDYMVGSYQVYRGTSSNNLQQIWGGAGLAYSDTRVTSGTTYYYAVAAVDVAKNVSALSQPVIAVAPQSAHAR
jgi:fibronectin type 3 domain-containing protein